MESCASKPVIAPEPGPGMMERRFGRWRNGWALLFLMMATVIVYWPALHGDFIWDVKTMGNTS